MTEECNVDLYGSVRRGYGGGESGGEGISERG